MSTAIPTYVSFGGGVAVPGAAPALMVPVPVPEMEAVTEVPEPAVDTPVEPVQP